MAPPEQLLRRLLTSASLAARQPGWRSGPSPELETRVLADFAGWHDARRNQWCLPGFLTLPGTVALRAALGAFALALVVLVLFLGSLIQCHEMYQSAQDGLLVASLDSEP